MRSSRDRRVVRSLCPDFREQRNKSGRQNSYSTVLGGSLGPHCSGPHTRGQGFGTRRCRCGYASTPHKARFPMSINGKKIAILATHGFEQSELEVPRDRLKQQGAQVDIVSPEKG